MTDADDELAEPGQPDDPDEPDEPGEPDEPRQSDEQDASVARIEPVDTHDGDRLIVWSWLGTAVFAITALAGVAVDALVAVSTPVAIALFTIGVVVFARAFFYAVNERRTDLIGIGGLFFLAGSAPRRVQKQLLGSLGVQIAVALGTAALRPYTALAFGTLVPLYGLGLAGLWGARYGTFPPRPPEPERTRTR